MANEAGSSEGTLLLTSGHQTRPGRGEGAPADNFIFCYIASVIFSISFVIGFFLANYSDNDLSEISSAVVQTIPKLVESQDDSLREINHTGFDGLSTLLLEDGLEISTEGVIIRPKAKTDLWRKTYYEPVLIRDSAPFLYHSFKPSDHRWMFETDFELVAESQFDQAGVHLRVDETRWLKAGIEFVDGKPRLSCVVTNDFSDWSTQAWAIGENGTIHCKLRLHGCANASFVVEAWMIDHWEFIRIAHLDGLAKDTEIKVGLYAACPIDQRGCKAVFGSFNIRSGSHFDHSAQ